MPRSLWRSSTFVWFWAVYASATSASWMTLAGKLTGGSAATREKAIQSLRSIPRLESQLKAALRSPSTKFLALDVISNLSMTALLPELLSQSEQDENGAIYLAINSLLQKDTIPAISDHYVRQFRSRQKRPLPGVIEVVLLDTLGRLGVAIPMEEFRATFEAGDYPLQTATLYYARYRLLHFKDERYWSLLEQSLSSHYKQVRRQAVSLLSEMKKRGILRERVRGALKVCRKDLEGEIRRECETLG